MRKKLLITLGILIVLPILIVVVMRSQRHKFEPPVTVSNRVLRLRNLFTEVYGARVGDKVILFDGGIDTEGPALDALLSALNATRDDVSDVFLSHGHFDHVAMSPLCKKAHIHVGAPDLDILARKTQYEPAAARWFGRVYPVEPITSDAPFHGREEVPLPDGGKLLAIPLPGHTPGSFVLYFDGVLFGGDSIQIDDGNLQFAMPAFSVDVAANKRGIAALKDALGTLPIDVVCTGHQGCTQRGEGRKLLDALIARASS
jgi:glyoxylase-like metal-dependent hydrolase (beta-lactamase superfamily II)